MSTAREAADQAALVDFLRRAYQAVDGLWFMMVEEASGFAQALELDRRVWEVLAKIQARKAWEVLGVRGNSAAELARCFGLKLAADGHECELAAEGGEVRVTIQQCPWLELLRRSRRGHLALRVAQEVCPTEGRVWAAEFGGEYEFEMPRMACGGAERCELRFRRVTPAQ